MNEYKSLLKKKHHGKLDKAVIYYGENPVDEVEVRDAETAAAELSALRQRIAAAEKDIKTLLETLDVVRQENYRLRGVLEKIANGENCDNDGRGCNNEGIARAALER